ncbi:MAG: type II toxin-antitoxin system VapC family toxin [Egibacteraceae bacterium]
MIVVDASSVVEFLLAGERGPAAVIGAFTQGDVLAPDLLDAEVLRVYVGFEKRGVLPADAVDRALAVLVDAPITRVPNAELVCAAWRYSRALSSDDALYVALAALLGCTLLTADGGIARTAPAQLGVAVTFVPRAAW